MAFAMNYLAGACSFNLRPKSGAKPISGDAKRLSGIGAARVGTNTRASRRSRDARELTIRRRLDRSVVFLHLYLAVDCFDAFSLTGDAHCLVGRFLGVRGSM